MSGPIERLDWDSDFFAVPIARVTATRLDAAAIAAVEHACRTQGIRCAYLLLDGDDARGRELAQAAGFVLRDVRVRLERPLADGDAGGEPPPGIGPATDAQRAALEAVARSAFAHTRFLDDARFPQARSRELYAAFLRRGLDGDPRRMTLADRDALGFVVCRVDRDAGVGEIELIAVAADARGAGLGGALVAGAVRMFARAGLAHASVVTQAANVASQRTYQRAGFRTREVGLWFHRWFD